ncbi:MarR family winged helix-turn-helix transcriptional regulator [Cohnella sp. REN36]|uniref:MarR family winged helix-turn-helix transcriptional regulator n=1 Tax=Cohnella sp. REN36 TaxID=2887347 RepID=UPI001D13A362|nr:MarR family transcriptional regulator [Cohnella sp. REN36]MCC3374862.1 MarR family transcriptional regulator [Cohnella sp. REN36]
MKDRSYAAEDRLPMKALIALSRSYRAVMTKLGQQIERHGLNPTEFAVLEFLYHKGDQPTQKIGEKILITSGSITYVVDKLERKGYLKRKRCDQDRRVIYASITPKGKELMDRMFPEHAEEIHRLFSVLDESEKLQMVEMLKKLGMHAEKQE